LPVSQFSMFSELEFPPQLEHLFLNIINYNREACREFEIACTAISERMCMLTSLKLLNITYHGPSPFIICNILHKTAYRLPTSLTHLGIHWVSDYSDLYCDLSNPGHVYLLYDVELTSLISSLFKLKNLRVIALELPAGIISDRKYEKALQKLERIDIKTDLVPIGLWSFYMFSNIQHFECSICKTTPDELYSFFKLLTRATSIKCLILEITRYELFTEETIQKIADLLADIKYREISINFSAKDISISEWVFQVLDETPYNTGTQKVPASVKNFLQPFFANLKLAYFQLKAENYKFYDNDFTFIRKKMHMYMV